MIGNWSCLLLFLSISRTRALKSPCLGKEYVKLRYFYPQNDPYNITLAYTDKIENRIIGEIFRILVEEKLNYRVEKVKQEEEKQAKQTNLTHCHEDENSCEDKMNIENPPSAMVTLDKMLPLSQTVDWLGLMDIGQLGPAVRYGWYIPERTAAGPSALLTHWRILQQKEKLSIFKPTPSQYTFVAKMAAKTKMSAGCSKCFDGLFTPTWCQGSVSPTNGCALVLTTFPSNTSMYNTTVIVEEILQEQFYVIVAFVGDGLESVVSFMEQSSRDTNNSYIVLHYHPSALTIKNNLTPILFPECNDPLLKRDTSDPTCIYSANKLTKIAWKQIENGAPDLYSFLERFVFSYTDYDKLLEFYNSKTEKHPSLTTEQIACKWLKHKVPGKSGNMTYWYNKWHGHIKRRKKKLYIGGIFPISGTKYIAPELAIVAKMAVDDINANKTMLTNYDLSLDIKDGKCEPDVVMKMFIDIIRTKAISRFSSTVGVLGPSCSNTVEAIAGVSKHYRTVVVTYMAKGSISNENSDKYPYFFRTVASNKHNKYAFTELIRKLGWNKVAAITQDGQKYSDYMSTLQDTFQQHNINFVLNRKFPPNAPDLSPYLQDLKDRGAKIIIGDFYEPAARKVMCQAFKSKMTQKQGYVWLLPGWFTKTWYDVDKLKQQQENHENSPRIKTKNPYNQEDTFHMNDDIRVGDLPDCTTEELVQALNGHFSLVHKKFAPKNSVMETSKTVYKWKHQLKEKMNKVNREYRKIVRNKTTPMNINHNSGYVYDAVWLYAKALEELVQRDETFLQNLHSRRSVEAFVDIIKNIDFNGVSGRINFFGRTSRLSDIDIIQWSKEANDTKIRPNVIGLYKPNYTTHSDSDDLRNPDTLTLEEENIKWHTEDGEKPLDDDKNCGIFSDLARYLDIDCQYSIAVTFLFGFALLMLTSGILFFTIKRRYDLKMKETEQRMRALGLIDPMSVLTLDEWEIDRESVVINRKLGEGAFGMVYGGESCLGRDTDKQWVAIAVKTLKEGSSVEEKIDFLSEAEMMKRFDHTNIVKLLGVCTRNEPVYTVMEFMLYGDLKTYLLARRHLVNERNREEFDEVSNRRLTSMALDIASGLAYLSEKRYVHRDIACRNCLVNSDRVVKLADFGMTRPMAESEYYRFSRKGMLPVRWMSPESLAEGLFTPMSDIWSYGVILFEIITFGSFPFQGISNNQVLLHVKAGNTLTPPSGIKSQLTSLLQSCWDIAPTKRPSASEIAEVLGNNPRLVSPCIDVPLASVQIERTDSLEMIPTKMGLMSLPPHQAGGYAVPTEYSHMMGGEVVEFNGDSDKVTLRCDSGMCDVDDLVDMPHGYLMVGPGDQYNN